MGVPARQIGSSASLEPGRFDRLRRAMRERFGFAIEPDRLPHVSARLRTLAQTCGFDDLDSYVDDVLDAPTEDKISRLVNRLSTNHTYFYREPDHFAFLAEIALPEALERARQAGRYTIRLWSAACSTGQEPYSIVMCARERLGAQYKKWNLNVLATDISSEALVQARDASYELSVMDKLPEHVTTRYFDRLEAGRVRVKPCVREDVTFRRFNLTTAAWPFRHPIDVVFCRNVLIYFDDDTTEAIVKRLTQSVAPGGYLIVGQSESINRFRGDLEYVRPSIFRRPA